MKKHFHVHAHLQTWEQKLKSVWLQEKLSIKDGNWFERGTFRIVVVISKSERVLCHDNEEFLRWRLNVVRRKYRHATPLA